MTDYKEYYVVLREGSRNGDRIVRYFTVPKTTVNDEEDKFREDSDSLVDRVRDLYNDKGPIVVQTWRSYQTPEDPTIRSHELKAVFHHYIIS